MKAIKLAEPWKVACVDIEKPVPKEGEALDLIFTKKVDMMKIMTKTVTMDEAPATIIDIEKNPGDYMKFVVRVSDED
mgnify:CR=1 FL=1